MASVAKLCPPALALLCCLQPLRADDAGVSVSPDGDAYRVRATAYEALVANDGCLTSLRIGGVEFLKSADRIPRGAYFFQDGPLQLPAVEQPADNVITAQSDKASIRYECGPEGLQWTLANATDKRMVLVIVFDPAVGAVMSARGRYEKTPIERPWQESTWFRDKSKLRITGSTRLWGPWAGNHQVWQVDLAPHETTQVSLEVGVATGEEIARATEAAARVIEPPQDPEGPMWDLEALSEPPATHPAEGFEAEGLQALFYEGLPFEGSPTRKRP